MKTMKIFMIGLFISSNSYASSFKLVDSEIEEGDDDNPSYIHYTYKTNKPLKAKYFYGYDVDNDEYNLSIRFNNDDIKSTHIGSTRLMIDEQKYIKQLKVDEDPLDVHCFFTGDIMIEIDEVVLSKNSVTSSSYGIVFLRSLKELGTKTLLCN